MAGQVLHGGTEFEVFAQPRVIEVEAGVGKAAIERVVGIPVFPGGDRSGNFVERSRIKSHGFAHFAGGHAVAISDHVGGHGRATLSVALVNVLDHAFALVAGGQVDIDVGPLAT